MGNGKLNTAYPSIRQLGAPYSIESGTGKGMKMNQNDIILMLYTMMFAFVCYTAYKIFIAKKQIQGEQDLFPQHKRILQYVLVGLLMSMILMVEGMYFKLMLAGITTYFVYNLFEQISFSDTGVYFNGKITEWNDIKQWSFSPKNGNLILALNNPKPNDVRVIPTRAEDQDAVNKVMRTRKSKKRAKK